LIKYNELENFDYLTPGLVDEIRSGKDYLESPPTLFKLDNSNVCNLNCIMCTREDIEDNRVLQKKTITELEAFLPTAKTFLLSGNGDPFVRPDTREILMNYKGPAKFDLITNALLMPRYWERVKHQKFRSISVSMDAATKETYEKIRVGGKWDDLLNSLSLVQENRNKFEYITINMTVMRSNYREIPRFIDFAESYGFHVSFQGMRGQGKDGNYGHENIFELKDTKALNELRNILINESSKKRDIGISWGDLVTYLNL